MAKTRRSPSSMTNSVNDLPAPDTKRWNVHRKAQVVHAVRAGILSLEEACRRYTKGPYY